VAELIRHINDPEHPLTLEQLNVAQEACIAVDDAGGAVRVGFTPTIPHCSMATLIGLCIRVRLLRTLPERFKVDVLINPGTHQSELAGACVCRHSQTRDRKKETERCVQVQCVRVYVCMCVCVCAAVLVGAG
jgi:metal-sulfur cluster biosynthetic enzyme